jgi:uncharacterized protein YdhG (YjbR/CyaY superfamily)
MKSTAADVRAYIADQPVEWQGTLKTLRAACRKHLDGYSEVMAYGMPSYIRDGAAEVSFAKQAHYLSLYILNKSVLDANRSRFAGLDVGKGCVRYRHPRQLDWDVVTDLLVATASSKSPVC